MLPGLMHIKLPNTIIWLAVATALLMLAIPLTVAAADRKYTIALIEDGAKYRTGADRGFFLDELLKLTEGEFRIQTKPFEANWSDTSIREAFSAAYADPEVDMVLARGITANQIGVGRAEFPKPTFLPYIIDPELMNAPRDGGSSGKHNLSYLSDNRDLSDELKALQRLLPFKSLVFLTDSEVIKAVPESVRNALREASGISVAFIGHDGNTQDLFDKFPADVDAILIAELPRLTDADSAELLYTLTERGLPTFSLLGEQAVAQGMLASEAPAADWVRLARRNALNMQAVMLGERAQDQPVVFDAKRQLTINMDIARKIGLSPRFDVLSEAVLLNEEPQARGPIYTLKRVAQIAQQSNLDLLIESYNVDVGSQQVSTARSGLLPQLSVQGSQLYRKDDTPNVQAGVLAEESSDGRLNLSQVLYSDDAWANLRIQQYQQLGREAALEQIRLDTIQASTTAFLNVLRTESQLLIRQNNLKLTKANLELARDRVRLGSATASDQYRWESQLATDRATLLTSRASYDQARENLNRILHRPLTEQFQVQVANIADPFFMTQEEYNAMVDNPRKYQRMTRYGVEQALLLAPELTQIKTALDAKQRELTNLRRAYWLPDFTVSGQYTDNFSQQGGAPAAADLEDWQVSVNATLPIFSGGSRRSEVSRARLEVKQLEASFASVRERAEQRTRGAFHDLNAVYVNIELSESAAESSRKNLELVTDSYSKGVVSIIELVDAQNSSLAADLTAANARYDFLVVAMELQRSIGVFDFLLPADVQAEGLKWLQEYLDNETR